MSNSARNVLLSEDEEELHPTVIERQTAPRKGLFKLSLEPVDGVRPESLKELRTRLTSKIDEKKVIDKALNLRLDSLLG